MRNHTRETAHSLTSGVICQIGAIAEYVATPASELSSADLCAVFGALMQAAYDVDARLGFVATFDPDDHGRAA